MLKQCYFYAKLYSKLFITFKMAYYFCFSLGGIKIFYICFITSTTEFKTSP